MYNIWIENHNIDSILNHPLKHTMQLNKMKRNGMEKVTTFPNEFAKAMNVPDTMYHMQFGFISAGL